MNICPICKLPVEEGQPSNILREKGSNGINTASKVRGDFNIINTSAGDIVHSECRRSYVNRNVIQKALQQNKTMDTAKPDSDICMLNLRSRDFTPFIFAEHCLFCGIPTKCNGKKRGMDVYPVRTLDFKKTVEDICNKRNDSWSDEVHGRLEFINDLPAADAVYHQACSVNFRTNKNVPLAFMPKKQKIKQGRPASDLQTEAFMKITQFLEEHPEEQHSMSTLVSMMKDDVGDAAYSSVHMKSRLQKNFGISIVISEVSGCSDVVTLQFTASNILHAFYQKPKTSDSEAEKEKLIMTAAKLIKSDIQEVSKSHTKSTYPTSVDLSSEVANLEFVPHSLQLLLQSLFSEKDSRLKIASIGQAIMQASSPRSLIAPLQFGLGVQAHHQFGSRFLVDTLNSLGFCVSYREIQTFEGNAAASHGTDIGEITDNHVIQYIADNVDHNIRTLDGKGSFHGMGIIAGITPEVSWKHPVPRTDVSLADVSAIARINIEFFKVCQDPFGANLFEKLQGNHSDDPTWKLDMLSTIAWPLRPQRQGWSATMQAVQKGNYPGKSSVIFLPIIDLDPSNMSCIYSTMKFVCREAERHKSHPVLTFDQPLYWKGNMIIATEPPSSSLKSVVLRLGGFHLEMSFLGSIGHLMRGSGLQEGLETVYAPNAVVHMLSGKAVTRALRGHFLVDTALTAILLSNIYNITLPQHCNENNLEVKEGIQDSSNPETTEDHNDEVLPIQENPVNELTQAADLFDSLLSKDKTLDDVLASDLLEKVKEKLLSKRASLQDHRTARLWMQYMDVIDLLRRFIKAERTGNWNLHLDTVYNMLPYFAAAGHNLYTKSAYMYLQKMQALKIDNPEVHAAFVSGHHVLRRTDRFWAGLSTDLVIEQVLMRSIKSVGGLTRGRGLTEKQRAVWLLSMSACADLNHAMQEVTNVNFQTSEQHKESGQSRCARDEKDTVSILNYLYDRNPFDGDMSLRSIETGVTDDGKANADTTKTVGEKILNTMEGQKISEYVFKKAHKAINLYTNQFVRVGKTVVDIDPQLLFQRLITASNGLVEDVSTIFKYELSTYPSSLFESSGLLRASQKSSLADAVWDMTRCSSIFPTENVHYVLDGGSLLHRIPWSRGESFTVICNKYIRYVTAKFHGINGRPTIVFDGYENGPSTKDTTHQRRNGGSVASKVNLSSTATLQTKKEHFLSNVKNKQSFIKMLADALESSGCRTIHADNDADVLIVKTAIEKAAEHSVAVIGEDTDLLVLLLYHVSTEMNDIYFNPDHSSSKKTKVWNIQVTKREIGKDMCGHLPFIHAVSGCDTTSRIFGIGKRAALKKMKLDSALKQQADVFSSETSVENITAAGEKAIAILSNSRDSNDRLDAIRYEKFLEKVILGKSFVPVHILPPTSDAAYFHSLRVYLQVQTWIQLYCPFRPEEWGWTLTEGKLQPIKTSLPPAPDCLLKVIRCNCKHNCDSMRCTCRKHGLECTHSCGGCKGVSCSNGQIPSEVLNDSDQLTD